MHVDDQRHLDTCHVARGLLEAQLHRPLTVVEHATLAVLSGFTSARDWAAATDGVHPRPFDEVLDAAVAAAVDRSLPALLGRAAGDEGGTR